MQALIRKADFRADDSLFVEIELQPNNELEHDRLLAALEAMKLQEVGLEVIAHKRNDVLTLDVSGSIDIKGTKNPHLISIKRVPSRGKKRIATLNAIPK